MELLLRVGSSRNTAYEDAFKHKPRLHCRNSVYDWTRNHMTSAEKNAVLDMITDAERKILDNNLDPSTAKLVEAAGLVSEDRKNTDIGRGEPTVSGYRVMKVGEQVYQSLYYHLYTQAKPNKLENGWKLHCISTEEDACTVIAQALELLGLLYVRTTNGYGGEITYETEG